VRQRLRTRTSRQRSKLAEGSQEGEKGRRSKKNFEKKRIKIIGEKKIQKYKKT
jgi:hypothetical protein